MVVRGPKPTHLSIVAFSGTPLGVVARPGTGKTFALMRHVVRLLKEVASEMAISQHLSGDREKGRFPGCDEVPTIRNRLADVFFISDRKLGSLKLLVTLPESSSVR